VRTRRPDLPLPDALDRLPVEGVYPGAHAQLPRVGRRSCERRHAHDVNYLLFCNNNVLNYITQNVNDTSMTRTACNGATYPALQIDPFIFAVLITRTKTSY